MKSLANGAWILRSLADLCSRVTSGGTPSRSRRDYYYPPTIPWVKTGDLDDKFVAAYDEYISEAGVAGSSAKVLPAGGPSVVGEAGRNVGRPHK